MAFSQILNLGQLEITRMKLYFALFFTEENSLETNVVGHSVRSRYYDNTFSS